MFGKGKDKKAKPASAREATTNTIIQEVEQLAPGQQLIYKLPELYASGFAAFLIAELNPSYPDKGKKYIYSTDKTLDGRPAGQKKRAWESDKPREYANWVVDRGGQRFS